MSIKSRADLKSFFVTNALPTQGNFADLIDSGLNQAQDGVFRPEGEPLSIVAATGAQKRVLRLYGAYPAPNPDWMISLDSGLGFTDGTGNKRLLIAGEAGMAQVTVGSGANGRLKTRHIDGKNYLDDTDDTLYLNHDTQKWVWVNRPDKPAGLEIFGGLNISTQESNSGLRLSGKTNWVSLFTNLGPGSWNPISADADRGIIYGGSGVDAPGGGFVIAPWRSGPGGLRFDETGNVGVAGALGFGAKTRQMLNLWNADYGVGVQDWTLYFRAAKNVAFYKGGSHNNAELDAGGGTPMLTINDGNVDVAGKLTANGGATIQGGTGLHITGAAGTADTLLTVGAGGNGRLKVRHIDGKDASANNANDVLYLNYDTGQTVNINSTERTGGLDVYGRVNINGALAVSGILKIRDIQGLNLLDDATSGGLVLNGNGGPVCIQSGPLPPPPGPKSDDQIWNNSLYVAGNALVNGSMWVSAIRAPRGRGDFRLSDNGLPVVVGQITQPTPPNGWGAALYVVGNVTATGIISGQQKQFRIDHPLDPENRYLVHSAIEGPEAAVLYRGEAALADGQCEVALPAYFEALTQQENRTVQITPKLEKGAETSALAAGAVEDGRFIVRTIDKRNPSQRFFWEVKAVRADIDPIVVEPLKSSM